MKLSEYFFKIAKLFIICFNILLLALTIKLFFDGFGLDFNGEFKITEVIATLSLFVTSFLSLLIYKVTKISTGVIVRDSEKLKEQSKLKLKIIVSKMAEVITSLSGNYRLQLDVSKYVVDQHGKTPDSFLRDAVHRRMELNSKKMLFNIDQWKSMYWTIFNDPDLLSFVFDHWKSIEELNFSMQVIEDRIRNGLELCDYNNFNSLHDLANLIVDSHNSMLNFTMNNLDEKKLNPILGELGIIK